MTDFNKYHHPDCIFKDPGGPTCCKSLYEDEFPFISEENRCNESSHNGYLICFRKKGHKGMHASVRSGGKLSAIFPTERTRNKNGN